MVARVGAGDAIDARSLAAVIEASGHRHVEQARQRRAAGTTEAVIEDDWAWFLTRSAAMGSLVRALLDGRADAWPFAAMQPWATGVRDTLAWPRDDLGDALAHAFGRDGDARVSPEIAEAWLARWCGPDAGGDDLDVTRLPAAIRRAVFATAHDAGRPEPVRRLRRLARLFATWPPARGMRVAPEALAQDAAAEPMRTDAGSLASRAGGLIAWALLFQRAELDALTSDLADERTRRAGRWAIARALELPQLSERDPLLLLWAGERIDGPGIARWVFRDLDPEPMHAAAVRIAAARGWLNEAIRLAPVGTTTVAMAGGLCLDFLPGAPVDVLPSIVRRFRDRAGRSPAEVIVDDRASLAVIDAITEIDVTALPDPWRAATRAAASVARRCARDGWRASVSDLRGWPATVSGDVVPEVRLPPAYARAVPENLSGSAVTLAGGAVKVSVSISS
jgi:hypothetical protein